MKYDFVDLQTVEYHFYKQNYVSTFLNKKKGKQTVCSKYTYDTTRLTYDSFILDMKEKLKIFKNKSFLVHHFIKCIILFFIRKKKFSFNIPFLITKASIFVFYFQNVKETKSISLFFIFLMT